MVHRRACRLSNVGVTRAGAVRVTVRVGTTVVAGSRSSQSCSVGPVVVHVDHADHVGVTNV